MTMKTVGFIALDENNKPISNKVHKNKGLKTIAERKHQHKVTKKNQEVLLKESFGKLSRIASKYNSNKWV